MEPEASFYSDCPTDLIPSFSIPKGSIETIGSSPDSESSDDLIDFLDCGNPFLVPEHVKPAKNWVHVEETKFSQEKTEFASISMDLGMPLMIRFYREERNIVSQVGVFRNVSLDEIITCFKYQTQLAKFIDIRLVFENCTQENVMTYQAALLSFSRYLKQFKREVILKCVIEMDTFQYASLLKDCLRELSNSLVELNLGKTRDLDYVLRVSPDLNDGIEARGAQELLQQWLEILHKSLRCLRIYSSVIINEELAECISNCLSITHLTLSKIIHTKITARFTNIQSLEYDGQNLAYTDEELKFTKRIMMLFPSMNIICFKGTVYDPVINEFLKSRHLVESGKIIHIYQPVSDLKKVKNQLTIIYPKTEPLNSEFPRTLTMHHPTSYTRIVLYRAGETFRNPF